LNKTENNTSKLQLEVRDSLVDISPSSWNNLNVLDNPFLRFEFLVALEDTGCLTKSSGWYPRYFLLWSADVEGELIAAVPCYVKTHSYGEFVFDWAWAEAYEQHGLEYYPKLIAAIPFTPATGQRLLVSPEHARAPIINLLAASIRHYCLEQKYSSMHWLFPTKEEAEQLCQNSPLIVDNATSDDEVDDDESLDRLDADANDHLQRIACQYHWQNRDYQSFDEFLQQCTSKRRKTIKRERRHVSDANLRLERRLGTSLGDEEWQWAHQFYCATYDRKWGSPSLTLAFFKQMGKTMGDDTLIVFAYDDNDSTPEVPVACSIMFIGGGCLYGRYWGCREHYNSLHFEACYYQGIEHCIEHGIDTFEPGAQGEHKITRGFEPTLTYSAHFIAESAFRDAVGRFLKEETRYMKDRCEGLTNLLPFKATITTN
jgi:predicted N-acyltransferase